MGSIIEANCDCGYKKNMFLGGGMSNILIPYCNFPYYCSDCRSLFEANIFEKQICCPSCGKENIISYTDKRTQKSKGNVIFYWNAGSKIDNELKLTDGKYFCPACDKFSLVFTDMGCWD